MILVDFTPEGGQLQRLSTEYAALKYQWFGYITSMSTMKLALPSRHGGIARPEFARIAISPKLMADLGSYPKTAAVRIVETDDDEAGGTVLYTGTASLDQYDRHGFSYTLKRPELPAIVASGTVYNNTLVNVASALCTAMGLTLDSSEARSPSPAVLHTTTSERLAIDLLSEICRFFCHGGRIIGSTLYLFDMLGTWPAIDLTEFDIQPSEYRRDKPYSLIKSGDKSVPGAATNGEEYNAGTAYHTGSTNITTALNDINSILARDIATIRFISEQARPVILDRINLLDESLVLPVNVSGAITSIIYNYDTLSVEAEVSGSVTA